MRAAWALLLLAAFPAWAQMYKCVDKKGVTHYTDAPLPGCKGGAVDIRPIPSISGTEVRPRDEDFAQQDADFKRRQNERAAEEAQQRVERRKLDSRCSSLRQEAAVLSSGRPLVRFNEQGERVYVPDQVRDQRLARVREALSACP